MEKKYILEITENADGHTIVNSNNIGFSCIELIGWIRHKESDLLKQLDDVIDMKNKKLSRLEDRMNMMIKEGES